MTAFQIVFFVGLVIAFALGWVHYGLPLLRKYLKMRKLKKVSTLIKTRKDDEAITLLKETIDFSDLLDPAFTALYAILLQKEMYEEAENLLDDFPKDLKDSDDYLLQRGYLYYMQGEIESATILYKKVIERDSPKKGLALSNLGALLLHKGEDPKSAVNYMKRALQANPNSPINYGIYLNLSLAYNQIKSFSEALVHAEVGLSLLPKEGVPLNRAYAHHIIGLAYKGLGNVKEAKKQIMLAFELTPPGLAREKLQEELEKL